MNPPIEKMPPAAGAGRHHIPALENKKVDISDGYEKYQIEYEASRIHVRCRLIQNPFGADFAAFCKKALNAVERKILNGLT